MRRSTSLKPYAAYTFQFTHPGKGATCPVSRRNLPSAVSIHAPWEGCDSTLAVTYSSLGRFNSRTLGRVRRFTDEDLRLHPRVSIHAPWEGCDVFCYRSSYGLWRFQFTHPGKGATSMVSPTVARATSFNSRTLGRVRLSLVYSPITVMSVSIHAPWEGCDYNLSIRRDATLRFQFTHPGKGATGTTP